jgi:hypothetical protein
MDDRRSKPRLSVHLDAVWHADEERHSAQITDLSEGGCYLDTVGEVMVSELVAFRVLLPDDFQREMEVEDPQNKAWLQTPDGRRYPRIQGLAFRLLRQHGDVLLVTRDRSAETCNGVGMNMRKRGMTKMGKHFLRRAGRR